MSVSALSLSFLAGGLASLSPCVFPVLPLLAGSALQEHRGGPLAFATGMIITFTIVGVSLASLGSVFGVSNDTIRIFSAILLILAGASFLIPKSLPGFDRLFNKISSYGSLKLSRVNGKGLMGQFLIGLIIGIVWSPCTGPALGAAIGLAAKSETRMMGAISMLLFSVGAVLPFLGISYGLRGLLKKKLAIYKYAKFIRGGFGALMLIFGVSILTGGDKIFEAWLLSNMPTSFLEFITQF